MRLLVDTSVWIELLRRGKKPSKNLVSRIEDFVTCPPIVQEIFQGLRQGQESEYFASLFSSLPCVASPVPIERYIEAAELYRSGRARGLTVRSSVDSIIAAIAIKESLTVLHKDRDFLQIAKYSGLKQITEV